MRITSTSALKFIINVQRERIYHDLEAQKAALVAVALGSRASTNLSARNRLECPERVTCDKAIHSRIIRLTEAEQSRRSIVAAASAAAARRPPSFFGGAHRGATSQDAAAALHSAGRAAGRRSQLKTRNRIRNRSDLIVCQWRQADGKRSSRRRQRQRRGTARAPLASTAAVRQLPLPV